jgi:uncharacterized protein YkwD
MKKFAFFVVLSLLLAGCSGTATKHVPFDAPELNATTKKMYLDKINEARSVGRYCGDEWYPAAPSLKWSDDLYRAAAEHSYDMAMTSHYDHVGSGSESDWTAVVLGKEGGSTVKERMENNNIVFPSTKWSAGENISAAEGPDEIDSMIEGYLASPHHCENIMNPHFTHFGTAFAYDENSEWGWYNSQEFMGE